MLEILISETRPALGCNGPIGACFVAAHAYDAIGGEITRIVVDNANAKCDDVAFPGTEYLGVEMAYALGAVCGDPNAGLEVLRNVTPEGELKARALADKVELHMNKDYDMLNFPHTVTVYTDRGYGAATVQGAPDGLIYKARNGEAVLEKPIDALNKPGKSPLMKYKIKDFYDFAANAPAERLAFLAEAADMNMRMAEYALEHDGVGIGIARSLMGSADKSATALSKIYAAAGCEGRMSGVNMPVMSLAGKGNVGVAASLPISVYARETGKDGEVVLRALALSFLLAAAVIHRIGKAPTMCSCEVAASLGVAAGLTMLGGGSYEQVCAAVQNFVPNVFGVVCDGAKLACALRLASSTGVAADCAALALSGVRLANNQGVLGEDADASIDFLGEFALKSMGESDRSLNQAMFGKRRIFPLTTFKERQRT